MSASHGSGEAPFHLFFTHILETNGVLGFWGSASRKKCLMRHHVQNQRKQHQRHSRHNTSRPSTRVMVPPAQQTSIVATPPTNAVTRAVQRLSFPLGLGEDMDDEFARSEQGAELSPLLPFDDESMSEPLVEPMFLTHQEHPSNVPSYQIPWKPNRFSRVLLDEAWSSL